MSETPPAPTTGSVILDIGEGVGALVVSVDPALSGREIEARGAGSGGHRAHATVLERRTAAGPVHAVVIAGLPEGQYTLWLDAATQWSERVVSVIGGQVTEVDERAES